MKIDDLYWMFSTIAQTLGAIVGIIGMLSVYRVQNLTSSMSNLIRQSESSLFYHLGKDSIARKPELILAKWKEFTVGHKVRDKAERTALERLMDEITDSLAIRKAIRFKFLLFLIPNLILIVASILALPFSCTLAQWGVWIVVCVGTFLTLITFGLTIFLCYSLIES